MVKIALVFPIFNKLQYSKKGLADLFKCFNTHCEEKLPIEIIITDDGSTDGSYEWIKTNYPHIHLLKGNGNLWWSGGINKAVKYAIDKLNIDYILLWNNDVRPDTNYFTFLFQLLEKNDPNTILCSKIYHEENQDIILSIGGEFNPYSGKYVLNGYGEKDSEYFERPLVADWFPGMGTIIHKNVFSKTGFFDDKNFPQYHGDSDFALRAKDAGFKIIAQPGLKIWNDRTNTGYSNNDSFKTFIKSLVNLKSNFNLSKDIQFYKKHAKSIFAYNFLIKKYFRHIGGYFKWRLLNIIGIKRKADKFTIS